MIAALLILVAALAYIVHERLDLARFNSQARGSALPCGAKGGDDVQA